MGTDDLFHKNKKTQERKEGNRKSHPRILIVCEGLKTEPLYFKGFCSHYFQEGLKQKIIEIKARPYGNDPLKVVEHAKQRQEEFDKVYCVFDQDEHSNFDKAVKICSGTKGTIIAITSIPCFEYWLLLHYKFSTKPFSRTEKLSPGDLAEKELKDHIENYKKNDPDIFEITKNKLSDAIKNAKLVEKECRETGTNNPSTKVYQLVEYLQELAKKIREIN